MSAKQIINVMSTYKNNNNNNKCEVKNQDLLSALYRLSKKVLFSDQKKKSALYHFMFNCFIHEALILKC